MTTPTTAGNGAEPSTGRVVAQVAGGSVVAMGAAAGVCAIAGVLGAVPATVGIILAAPVYAAGHLVVRSRLRHRQAVAAPPVVDDDAATLAALDRLLAEIHGKVPSTVEARVEHVANTVRQTVPRLGQLGAGSETAHSVLRTATNYLPEAVAAYMRLPREFADHRAVSGGKTSLTVLCDQLDLLGSKMDEVFDAVCRADADALIANGRFISEKFAAGSLALGPQGS